MSQMKISCPLHGWVNPDFEKEKPELYFDKPVCPICKGQAAVRKIIQVEDKSIGNTKLEHR